MFQLHDRSGGPTIKFLPRVGAASRRKEAAHVHRQTNADRARRGRGLFGAEYLSAPSASLPNSTNRAQKVAGPHIAFLYLRRSGAKA